MLPFCILYLKVLLSDLCKKVVLLAFIFKGGIVSVNGSPSTCTLTQLSLSMSRGTEVFILIFFLFTITVRFVHDCSACFLLPL